MPAGDLLQIKEYHCHKLYRPAAYYLIPPEDHRLAVADGKDIS